MNPKHIKLIIGLMALALAGSIGLQMYWIGWSIRLNEERFDKDIFGALNGVSAKLEAVENAKVMEALSKSSGSGPSQNLRKAARYLESGFAMRRVQVPVDSAAQAADADSSAVVENVSAWEYMKVSQLVDAQPLAERINLELLANTLHEELENKGIQTDIQYGIWSKARENFVIVNDHYVVFDNPDNAKWAFNLQTSQYKVTLFRQDINPPGYLTLYFPRRTSLVLNSIWPTLALSVIFTSIILFCFWYTIQVIFRQKQLSEMKNDFINNMTHEFKTPIATISLAADSITNPTIISNPDKIRRFSDIIRQENKRMNAQVERVLQMAMVDKKDFQLKLSEINIHELIEEALENFSLQVEKREGSLTSDLQATRPLIEGDATHIASIIHNLLDNANKYSPETPNIIVRTRDASHGIEISVQDHGIGIGKEARKHIFDKFYRVHTGNLHDVKGFGLGLSYVKAIMVAHKGIVDVKSDLGKGSTFTLMFPYQQS